MPQRTFHIPNRSAVLISVETRGTGPVGVITSPTIDGGRSFLFPDRAVDGILPSASGQQACGGQLISLTLTGTSITIEGGIEKPFDKLRVPSPVEGEGGGIIRFPSSSITSTNTISVSENLDTLLV
jgi:hypothetical protein